MTDFKEKDSYTFTDLVEIMKLLRIECPWDRVQTHQSIRRNFIEETYEVLEAVDNENTELLKEELGDVLLQVIFHTEIEREKGHFTIDDVADGICKKLIFRHPHIFKNKKINSTEEVLNAWDDLKKIEKGQKSTTDSLVSVAKTLPGLIRSEKIQAKAAKVGFDWPDTEAALQKMQEETLELTTAIREDSNKEEELGDLLFAVVNVARFLKIDPEGALEKTCDKFIRRFSYVEQQVKSQNRNWEDLTLGELCSLWDEKRNEEKGMK